MIDRDPPLIVTEILIHVDQKHIAEVDPPVVNYSGENRILIDRPDRNDLIVARMPGVAAPPADFVEHRPGHMAGKGVGITDHFDRNRRAPAEILGCNLKMREAGWSCLDASDGSDGNVLGFQETVQALGPELASPAALLESAERRIAARRARYRR